MTVTLNGRKFYKDGDWNTVCLPFNLNGDTFISSPFSSAISIMELDTHGEYDGHKTGFDASTGILYLYFKDVNFDDDTTDENNYGDGMLAGVPYLVKWPVDANVTNPMFTGVTIDATAPAAVVASNTGLNRVTFQGTYDPISYNNIMDKSILLLGANSSLYYPDGSASTNIKAFRAYFQVELGNAPGVKAFVLSFGEDDDATAIEMVNGQSSSLRSGAGGTMVNEIYNLAGQRLNKMQKGINIINGKKVLK